MGDPASQLRSSPRSQSPILRVFSLESRVYSLEDLEESRVDSSSPDSTGLCASGPKDSDQTEVEEEVKQTGWEEEGCKGGNSREEGGGLEIYQEKGKLEKEK